MTFAIEPGAEPLIARWRIKFKAVITAQGFAIGRIEPHRTTQSLSAVRAFIGGPNSILTTNSRRLESEGRNGILFDKDNNSAIALASIVIEPSA
jgi:hypothetical protein